MTARGRAALAVPAALIAAVVGVSACSSGSGPADSSPPSSGGSSVSSLSGSAVSTAGSPGGPASSTAPGSSTGTGAPYPTSGPVPSPQNDQSGVLAALPGSAAATCGAVGTQPQLRAGSIAAGNFVTARSSYHAHGAGTTITLFVIPAQMANTTSASVTVAGLGGQAPAKTTTSTSRSVAEAWTYFTVPVTIGAAGPYRLTVTAGANRGCFDVSFS